METVFKDTTILLVWHLQMVSLRNYIVKQLSIKKVKRLSYPW